MELRLGGFCVRGAPERSAPFEEVCREACSRNGGAPVEGEGEYDPPTQAADEKTLFGNIAPAYEFAAQTAEVEVDTETGQVDLLDFASVDDVGRIVSALGAEGQTEGAISQGMPDTTLKPPVIAMAMSAPSDDSAIKVSGGAGGAPECSKRRIDMARSCMGESKLISG